MMTPSIPFNSLGRLVLVFALTLSACGGQADTADPNDRDAGTTPDDSDSGAAPRTMADASGTSPDNAGTLVDAAIDETEAAARGYARGIYFVPERSDVSTYSVDEVVWSVDGNRVTLAYNLPRLLVGKSERVAFVGDRDGSETAATLTGPLGTAECLFDESAAFPHTCEEHFIGLMVDLDRVREEARRDDPARVEERVSVAARFAGDPIGVLELNEIVRDLEARDRCLQAEQCPLASHCDADIPGQAGYCEPESGTLPVNAPCDLDFECAPELECEIDDTGARTCQASGRGR